MNWIARIKCWWSGHKLESVYYTMEGHNGIEKRHYTGCSRCGAGTKEEELRSWDSDGFAWEHRDGLGFLLFISICLAVIIVLGLVVLVGTRYSCKINGEIMDLPWKFHWLTGNCYYEVKGQWIQRSLLQVVDLLK